MGGEGSRRLATSERGFASWAPFVDLALCERRRAIDFAEIAIVRIAILVDVAGDGYVALRVIGQGCHGFTLILIVEPPAARNVVCPLSHGSHDCGGSV
jgi:hypothetical protein